MKPTKSFLVIALFIAIKNGELHKVKFFVENDITLVNQSDNKQSDKYSDIELDFVRKLILEIEIIK